MQCNVVTLPGKCKRYVASTAEGRVMRELFIQEFNCKKKDVTIEPAVIPTQKADLLLFVNEMLTRIDAEAAK